MAFVALEAGDVLRLQACYGTTLRQVPFSSVARHWVNRNLPIILENIDEQSRFRNDPLVFGPPRMSFFVSVPLMLTKDTSFGALCMLSRAPRKFMLDDATELQQCADEIGSLYCEVSQGRALWCFTVSSLPEVSQDLEDESGVEDVED